MKIYKQSIFTIMLFLICITNTYAACTQEEINEFKKIADEYTIKYEFNKETKDYTVTFYAPLMDKYNYSIPVEMGEITDMILIENGYIIKGIKPGEYKIEVSTNTPTCNNSLKTITLKLAKYNSFSEDPLCNDIEEFVLCQPTYDKDIDYETFASRVNTYKKNKENKVVEEVEEPVEKNEILEYIKNNLIQIIIISIFVILVLITAIITIKSIRKSRRLE